MDGKTNTTHYGLEKEIDLVKCFESDEAKRYWIGALNLSKGEKGYLIYYFKLM